MALRCALLVAVFLAAADVAVAKGGGHGGAQNSGIHGAVFGTHHPVFADNHTFANNTFAIVRNPSLLYAILDPYALDCIMKNWHLTSQQLKIVIVMKVITGILTFYYIGLLLYHLLCRSPFGDYGLCKFYAATSPTDPGADGTYLVINIKKHVLELDHKLRGKKGFVGDIQVFSRVHALHEAAVSVRALSDRGEELINVGPLGTFQLNGIVEEDEMDEEERLDKTGQVVWKPHRGGEGGVDYANDEETQEELAPGFEHVEIDQFSLKPGGELTIFLRRNATIAREGKSSGDTSTSEYQWPFHSLGLDEGYQWVLKNEGRHSPFSSWLALMPLVILFDETLLFAEVRHLGNGQGNPYNGSSVTAALIVLVPVVALLINWFSFNAVNWTTDFDLDFGDIVSYKFNQFGIVTTMQTAVNKFRKDERVQATNHYQDLTCSLDKVVLVFVTQTLLVGYYFTALHHVSLYALDNLTLSRWLSALVLQAVVLAGKTDAGSGFFDEVPYWVCLHQEIKSQKLKGLTHIEFKEEGDNNKRAVSAFEIWLRMFMALLVNSFYRTLIIISLPASLASCTAPMDFVLNSFAILFVGTIDDMGEVKSFRLDFKDDLDTNGYGEYALNYVGLHLMESKSVGAKLSFLCTLCFPPTEATPTINAPTRTSSSQSPPDKDMLRRGGKSLLWGGVDGAERHKASQRPSSRSIPTATGAQNDIGTISQSSLL